MNKNNLDKIRETYAFICKAYFETECLLDELEGKSTAKKLIPIQDLVLAGIISLGELID